MPSVPKTMIKEAELITALGVCAVEHEKTCEETEDHDADCPKARGERPTSDAQRI